LGWFVQVLETRIRGCRDLARKGLSPTSSLDFKKSEENAVKELTANFEGQLGEDHRVRVIVLVLLATFSGLFAWIIQVIMCHEYF
jgi:hypothetical protein